MGIRIQTVLEKFGKNGEKTGWTYILLPAELARKVYPQDKKSFRIKGQIDDLPFSGQATLPMGDGDYILPVKSPWLKKLRKKAGDAVLLIMELDLQPYVLNPMMMECLEDDPMALQQFVSFTKSHQNYFSKWVDTAKTESTQAKRIAAILKAMHLKQDYSTMIRSQKKESLHL
jgi:hypothetical protein